ncbi:MAG: RNHCP domain-containing protein [Anaerolineales bacterium]|nr:RNHCP domain-containing protein [Anaerolineales bacterium]
MKGNSSPGEFACMRCGAIVSAAYERSGVRNRNHCPYCLWSRHLDWNSPGDRLSSCKSAMRPIGLTLKRNRNKYAVFPSGELMIVHRCPACGKVSANRVAADDAMECLAELFRDSLRLEAPFRRTADLSGVRILGSGDWEIVSRRLYGASRPAPSGRPQG